MKKNLMRSLSLFISLLSVISCTDDIDDNKETDRDDIAAEFVYYPSKMEITTEGNRKITGKTKADYVNCTIKIDSDFNNWDYEGTGKIRGRGNSTWAWYPKKPYRIKLDVKAEILGLGSERDWVLLANYRDPTHAMNCFAFNYGNIENMPYTNHSRYVEVTLNGDYIGVYLLTEQIEQGKKRVNIDDNEGLLLSLDLDDGPGLSPDESDNFFSKYYRLPVCVKYPEDITSEKLNAVKEIFAQLEFAVKNSSFEEIESMIDIESFIKYMILQELVQNVEINAPRSVFLYKNKDEKWTMGPLWDFDAGFDFDWSTMYTGHDYFGNYKELTMGYNPVIHGNQNYISPFFTDLFNHKEFVSKYKMQWSIISNKVIEEYWTETNKYLNACSEALDRDAKRWPIGKNRKIEITKMRSWLQLRTLFLNNIVKNYPDGTK